MTCLNMCNFLGPSFTILCVEYMISDNGQLYLASFIMARPLMLNYILQIRPSEGFKLSIQHHLDQVQTFL